jgi:diguanylate cyclase (GGDEF)-like protein
MLTDQFTPETLRATGISFAAIVVAVSGAALSPAAPDHEILLWVLAVVPAFLLAYHRGWHGIATVLAAMMAGLAAVQATAAWAQVDMAATGPVLRILLVAIGTTAGIGALADRLQRARVQAERLELTDEVTGLPNGRHLAQVLEREFAGAARGRDLTLVVFEIDDVAGYQVKHGRRSANAARRTFASVLRKRTRRMNFSARYEHGFVTVFASGDPAAAEVFVRKVMADFALAVGAGSPLSVSAGIADYDSTMAVPSALMRAAEFALFQAQQAGRGSVRTHERRTTPAHADELITNLRGLQQTST